jgi:pimeloyl-ACP methyl ester carboxylesterase
MSTFVLVHGASQGASTWDLVVPKLQATGHKVFTPVLTGLGEDSHRLSPAVNLDSHIGDVVDILKRESLQGVTLVGHSYAGMVITGVAERGSGRLSRLIYVDAFVPGDGESVLDLLPDPIQDSFRKEAQANGEVGGCRPRRVFWICGVYNPAPHASMCAAACVTSVCDVSSKRFGCRQMRPERCRRNL